MKLAKSYESNLYEKDIYNLWEQSGAFQPNNNAHHTYSIIMPPPNANGNLHLGHALSYQLEDLVIRYQRMQGRSTLLLPGADHAGFETWVVYEKYLAKQGKSRFDFSREELYQQVWDFVKLNRQNFENQLKALGISCDWSRFTFSLDDKVIKTAYTVFQKMWQDKLIYRGERLVNFCTFHGTSFADIEVDYKDVKTKLWSIAYPLVDSNQTIVVATTRPETMLGDTAIAVNPNDKRYKNFVGKTVHVPLTNREIPIITDQIVDPKFGTGAVKITPAHDFTDFEVALRHDLPKINVIDHEGHITADMPEPYRGKAYLDAREAIIQDLQAIGQLVEEKDYVHSVGHCYKCGTVLQPLIKDQWFIDMQPLAKQAIVALKEDKIKFFPKSKKTNLIKYLTQLKDWNLSRQIAWGIPIPAFQNLDKPDDWIFDTRVGEEIIVVNNQTYHRDPDVFDTWFTSSQWPYICLNYPAGSDFKKFYPTSLMETGADILYAWVARMIMLSLYITEDIPFREVYLNGLVLDAHGQKMSKSKDNVINPMQIINQNGADALRLGLIAGQSPGINQPFGTAKVVAGRNFCNKLWNIARFVENQLGDNYKYIDNPPLQSSADHWILNRLDTNITAIETAIDEYRMAEAYHKLYHFIWDDVADWYIEASKINPNLPMLAYILKTSLKLAHPFAPFVTETIWQTLELEGNALLINQSWPTGVKNYDKKMVTEFNEVKAIISEIRYINTALDIKFPSLYFKQQAFLIKNAPLIKRLAQLDNVAEVEAGRGMHLTKTKIDCWLDIDINTAQKYVNKLQSDQLTKQAVIDKLQARLANKSYTTKAPKAIIQQTKRQLASESLLLTKIQTELATFAHYGANSSI